MKPGPLADFALLEHMRDAIRRIREYTGMDAALARMLARVTAAGGGSTP